MKTLPTLFQLGTIASLALSLSAFGADKEPPAPKKPERPQPPTRSFEAPGAPKFTRLDGRPGTNPPLDVDGDFVVGPDYVPAPEFKVIEGVPQGKVEQFSMDSKDCKRFNPGIALFPYTTLFRSRKSVV